MTLFVLMFEEATAAGQQVAGSDPTVLAEETYWWTSSLDLLQQWFVHWYNHLLHDT